MFEKRIKEFTNYINKLSDNKTVIANVEQFIINGYKNKIEGIKLVSGFLNSNHWSEMLNVIMSSKFGFEIADNYLNTLEEVKNNFNYSFYKNGSPSQKVVFITYLLQKIIDLQNNINKFKKQHPNILQFLKDKGLGDELEFLNKFEELINEDNIKLAIQFITRFGSLLDLLDGYGCFSCCSN